MSKKRTFIQEGDIPKLHFFNGRYYIKLGDLKYFLPQAMRSSENMLQPVKDELISPDNVLITNDVYLTTAGVYQLKQIVYTDKLKALIPLLNKKEKSEITKDKKRGYSKNITINNIFNITPEDKVLAHDVFTAIKGKGSYDDWILGVINSSQYLATGFSGDMTHLNTILINRPIAQAIYANKSQANKNKIQKALKNSWQISFGTLY